MNENTWIYFTLALGTFFGLLLLAVGVIGLYQEHLKRLTREAEARAAKLREMVAIEHRGRIAAQTEATKAQCQLVAQAENTQKLVAQVQDLLKERLGGELPDDEKETFVMEPRPKGHAPAAREAPKVPQAISPAKVGDASKAPRAATGVAPKPPPVPPPKAPTAKAPTAKASPVKAPPVPPAKAPVDQPPVMASKVGTLHMYTIGGRFPRISPPTRGSA